MADSHENDQKGLKEALLLAEKAASEDEVPVGAIVVYQDQIVGRGYNLRETLQNPVAHAEVLAIQEAAQKLGSWRLTDCSLFVTLEPCPMCLSACQLSRVKDVCYGTPDPKGGALSLGYKVHEDSRTNHRFGVRLSEMNACGEILSRFFLNKRQR